ncbi:MAG: hypothetical protein WAN35_18650 [Terracidiphilus sp.]
MLEGALFPGSEFMAMLDERKRLLLKRKRDAEESGCIFRDSQPGKEIVVGFLEDGSGILSEVALPGGGDSDDFVDPEGIGNPLQRGEKQCVRGNIMQSFGGIADMGKGSFDALEPGNQQNLRRLGADHPSGNEVEGENKNNVSIHAQMERKFPFLITGPGHAHRQDKAIGVLGDFKDRNILLQSPAQEAIGQSLVQPIVVMTKTGGAFVYGKAPNKVILGEIFASKALAAENKLSIRRKPEEEAKKFTVGSCMGEASP